MTPMAGLKNPIRGQRCHCITPLKTADLFRVLKDQSSILERWTKHFNTLLNQDSDEDHIMLHLNVLQLNTLINPQHSMRFCRLCDH